MAGKTIFGKDVGLFRKTTIAPIFSGPRTAAFTASHTITFTGEVSSVFRDAVLNGLSIVITGTGANNGTYHYSTADVSPLVSGSFSIILTETVTTLASGTKTINVYASVDGATLYTPVVCGRSCVLTLNTELIEITTVSSSQFKEFLPQYSNWSVSFDGMANVDDANGLSVYDILNLQIAKTKLFFRTKALKEGSATQYIYMDGEGYATQSTLTGQDNSVASFSFNFQGTGNLTVGQV